MNANTLFVTYLKIGFLPKAPGTWATLATIPIWWVMSYLPEIAYLALTLIIAALGIVASDFYVKSTGTDDPSEIVIDEVVGFLITMALVPKTWIALVLGFVLFRLLDILKPWPISWADQKIKGGTGVMADDIFAGIIGNFLVHIIYIYALGRGLL